MLSSLAVRTRTASTLIFLGVRDADALFDDSGWCMELTVTAQVRAEAGGAVMGSGAGTGVVKATPLKPVGP